jgi:microcystin-dependent protein
MSDPFVAEIRMVPFNFAPRGWALCDGQLLPLSQNTALFSLLGTQYGGNGQTNFALPDLRGCSPMHHGQGPGLSLRFIGERGGSATVTLLASEMPQHNHAVAARSVNGTVNDPSGAVWAKARVGRANENRYAATPDTTMAPNAFGPSGSNAPHNNQQPYLTLNFIIALQGVYPPRS